MAENWLEMVEKRPFTFRELVKSGKNSLYVQDMHLPIVAKEQKDDRIKILVDYFSSNRNNHTFYAIKVGD